MSKILLIVVKVERDISMYLMTAAVNLDLLFLSSELLAVGLLKQFFIRIYELKELIGPI